MHKLTAKLIAAWAGVHAKASALSASVHAFLSDLHMSSITAVVRAADSRLLRVVRLRNYHDAAADEAHKLVEKAKAALTDAETWAKAEAAKIGEELHL